MKKIISACIDQVIEFDSPDEAAAFVDDLRREGKEFNVSSREEIGVKVRIRIQRPYNRNQLLKN